MANKISQSEKILDYIKRFGSISPMEAFTDLGITKLATRISEMSRDGIEFNKKYIQEKNRFGDSVFYMRYSLKSEVNKNGGTENVLSENH